jgi:SAM-dependent methyltransferase
VDAVDIDPAAVAAVRADARGDGRVRAVEADVTATGFPRPPYQVIVNVNFLERSLFPRFGRALAPGGLLLFETFTRDHVDVLGRRMNRDYLLEANELVRAFGDLRILRYRDGVVPGDPPRAVAGVVARRPSA